MDERRHFVARLLDSEKMAVVCREFGIFRKTGYKIFNRYQDYGLRGIENLTRSPYRLTSCRSRWRRPKHRLICADNIDDSESTILHAISDFSCGYF